MKENPMAEDALARIPTNVTPEQWEVWRKRHGNKIVRLGIPELIVSSEALWRDFFANGRMEYSGASDFRFEDMSDDSAIKLFKILEHSYTREILVELDLYILICRKFDIPESGRK